jgi:hypothetical protein
MTLIHAAKDGRTEVVKAVIEKGSDVNAKEESVSRGGGQHCRNESRYSETSVYPVASLTAS